LPRDPNSPTKGPYFHPVKADVAIIFLGRLLFDL
jgi:hypothetical protein